MSHQLEALTSWRAKKKQKGSQAMTHEPSARSTHQLNRKKKKAVRAWNMSDQLEALTFWTAKKSKKAVRAWNVSHRLEALTDWTAKKGCQGINKLTARSTHILNSKKKEKGSQGMKHGPSARSTHQLNRKKGSQGMTHKLSARSTYRLNSKKKRQSEHKTWAISSKHSHSEQKKKRQWKHEMWAIS
jgi:hypothetical protein